jgi:hypothetical protein
MRRLNLKRLISFITREHKLDINNIRRLFTTEQEKYLQIHPAWNSKASRRILCASYWFRETLLHFGVVLGIALIFTIHHYSSWLALFVSILIGGLPAFFCLTAFIYLPSFFYNFLPKLEVVSAEQEKLAAQGQETNKCKRTQFQAPTLIVIYYANCKISGTPLLPANDSSAKLLNKLFGSDKDKLKQNLSRLYKISSLSPKERAEMLKGVENARSFYIDSGHTNTLKILDELEFKLSKH